MIATDRLLVATMRLVGALMLLAIPAIAMPTSWMAAGHAALGLGVMPRGPLTEYLTRSISALYAVHGGMLLVLSRDVRRFAPAVAYVGIANVLFGVVVAGIDLYAGMPLLWTATEGPPIVAIGLLMLWLIRRLPATDGG